MDSNALTLEGHTFQFIQTKFDQNILWLTMNRPEKKNALHPVLINELLYCFDFAKETPDVRVVVLQSAGDVFCSGADLAAMSGKGDAITSTVPKKGELFDINLRMSNCFKPIICRVQGDVLAGALMLVGNSTHVIAADHAQFSAPEIKRGLWPHMVMASLFRVMPKRVALDFIMRGYKMPAAQAVQHGLISEAVPSAQLDEKVLALATELASLAPATIRLGLEAFHQQDSLSFEEAIPYLFQMLQKTISTEDAKEGITAFLQKRTPVWKGK